MNQENKYNYTPLQEPVLITEQQWPEGTLPLVHIRTMTYMHENFIRDCIEGILMQKTTFPVQVLIHDDASMDKTAEIVRDYELKHPGLIKAYYQKENTYSKKDKTEKEKLRKEFNSWRIGKYEALCEGDDYWTDPLKLQRQVVFLEENPDYVAVAENGLVKNALQQKEYLFSDEPERDLSIHEMVQKRRFPTASVLFKSDAAKYFSKETKQTIDTVLWCYLASKGKFRYFNRILSVYRRGLHGIVEGTDKYKWARRVELFMNEIIRLFGPYTDRSLVKEIIWQHYWILYKDYRRLYRSKMLFILLKCIIYQPGKTIHGIIKDM